MQLGNQYSASRWSHPRYPYPAGLLAEFGCWYTSTTLSISPLYYILQPSSKSFCQKLYTFFIAHSGCRLFERIYLWLKCQKEGLGGFFLIQMSSCMLCISKPDLLLTTPVFNPFETFLVPFLLLLVSKAILFLFHLINRNMVGFISAAWKSKIFEDIIWFDI